jgi:hypothetical protein
MKEFEMKSQMVTDVYVIHTPCGGRAIGMRAPTADITDEAMIVVMCLKCKVSELLAEVDYQNQLHNFEKKSGE